MNKTIKIQQKFNNNNGILKKNFDATNSAVLNDDRTIYVKFASFGNKDSDGDILVKGCFAKSIQERGPESSTNRKIAFLWQHDMKDPIGRILKLEEKEDGGYALIQLSDFDSVPNSKRAYSQLKDGTLNQFSFGFNYVKDKLDYDEEKDAFIVREVKMFEVSVVTLGANEESEFMGLSGSEDLKSILTDIAQKDKGRLNEIKQIINEIEAEPQTALTSEISLFEAIANN